MSAAQTSSPADRAEDARSARQGAFAAGVFTFTAFLTPVLLSPGAFELAHLAGLALAFWVGVEAWRQHRRFDLPATLPYRVEPVGPALIGAAILLFVSAVALGWAERSGDVSTRLAALDALLRDWWRFPLSPVELYAAPVSGVRDVTGAEVRAIAVLLTMALAFAGLYGFLALIGGIHQRETLRRHAVIWLGVDLRADDSQRALEARGVKGLRPVRDPLSALKPRPVSGPLFRRSLFLFFAAATIAYAPAVLRLFAASGGDAVSRFFANPIFASSFVAVWLDGLWAFCVASALVFAFAYLRLAITLSRP